MKKHQHCVVALSGENIAKEVKCSNKAKKQTQKHTRCMCK